MVPDKFNMVDMGGIDLILMQGEEVPGLYNRLVESIAQCRYQCLYNWLFDGVIIPPTYVEMEVNENDEVAINEGVVVTEDDVIHIYSIEPPPPEPEIIPLLATENGTYTAPEGVDGFNPVTVTVHTGATIINGGAYPTSEIGNNGDIYLRTFGQLQELVAQESELDVIVTANSSWPGYAPWKAFSLTGAWIGNGGNPHWLQIECPSVITIYGGYFEAGDSNRAKAVSRIGYSNDGVNFTDAILAESTMVNQKGHFDLAQGATGKYFRLYFDGDYGVSYYPMVGKLQIYIDDSLINGAYLKVSGIWQNLIGSDINDVNI